MNKKLLKYLLEITQVVQIIKKWSLSSKTDIKNIPNMAWRNDISVNIVNKISIREYKKNKRYQTSK